MGGAPLGDWWTVPESQYAWRYGRERLHLGGGKGEGEAGRDVAMRGKGEGGVWQ